MAEKKINTSDTKDIEENKVLAALSYLWFISIVILILKKDSPFAQFHAKQGIILFIASVICWFIPFLGWLLNLVIFVVIIVGFAQAISGKYWEIPLVSDLAKKLNI
ncbi:MAG: hypothetical protein A3B74_04215 [Candidatus Kerfeldbacteria bacterium RIFCSPHIGHO2_02_FULL_42_14]|uniref:Chloroplast import component protein (Tic20) n=1 Tax=Candidatus Kerfeldbacteria bacterium RIFCSPHIGHO2_02_FULL_42_14 TaxID=1798540 RepID=A0A1G2APR9_9BACT|nr:MAG: hypothetical protein A3B74_04215 [Candidatus Kerfeldbacteria bacterium RIFCSPHIGHO2_02_FULL_42_14]OGY81195.1 MAG: hypothetical protein A3E60_02805 [Candidatus Kerfeldbacteria bacterium RIFCSPHIGHO2_12_FULL_42_13]OGY83385.1 MAG: hypothetical protein A3I91_01905 [Candidatus Kerfeldbacteria bacterium RIFCSPLOWO2_02_FULL_42_19]OGY85492.1 MAG: hypothetical protein A3G01_03600 [Candidatus Kerfeldbacteria bacterium RIFCSPLOWO2_12_FULL_43_9]